MAPFEAFRMSFKYQTHKNDIVNYVETGVRRSLFFVAFSAFPLPLCFCFSLLPNPSCRLFFIIHSSFIHNKPSLPHAPLPPYLTSCTRTLIHFHFRIYVELIRLCGDHDSYKLNAPNNWTKKKGETRRNAGRRKTAGGTFVRMCGRRTAYTCFDAVIYANLFHDFTTLSTVGWKLLDETRAHSGHAQRGVNAALDNDGWRRTEVNHIILFLIFLVFFLRSHRRSRNAFRWDWDVRPTINSRPGWRNVTNKL